MHGGRRDTPTGGESLTQRRDDPVDPKGQRGGLASFDFSLPVFNRIDELQDCAGNYRSFETLDGIVTADMRQRFEQERGGSDVRESAPAAATARRTWQEAAAPPAPISIVSRGRVLVLDTDPGRAAACARILGERGMTCTEAVSGAGSRVRVQGAFGGFAATRESAGAPEAAAVASHVAAGPGTFDCVVDLQREPSYVGPLLPQGYYSPGQDVSRLEEALMELPEMRGRFEKPQFTLYFPGRCLRGRTHAAVCGRCIGTCPFGAIEAADRGVAVDHALCQGCGACALDCPAGALQTIVPSSAEVLARLRRVLEPAPEPGDPPTDLVFCETDDADFAEDCATAAGPDGGSRRRVVFTLEHIGHLRLETLLTAIRHGARSVLVVCPETAPRIAEAVRRQVVLASAILHALGLPKDAIRVAAAGVRTPGADPGGAAPPLTSWPEEPAPGPWPPAECAALARHAAQELFDRSGVPDPALPLPEGAAFGTVELAGNRCTLCMACAAACPTGALAAAGDVPRLEFREARCHQCGLCVQTCPEKALRLLPRLLCDPDVVARPVTVRAEDAARCLECGTPFAPQAMVDRMRAKLAGHWMYAEERQVRRLQLCRTCRARDVFVSRDVARWAR